MRLKLSIFLMYLRKSINVEKSSVFFSQNTAQNTKQEICSIIRFREADEHTTYLGLPNIIKRSKTSMFGYLKDRVRGRIQYWNKKMISKGGKEVLLKTIGQTLPNYAMSMFLLPRKSCTEIETMMSRYWWQTSSNKESGIRWMSWQRMSKRKTQGGMGFSKLI